MFLQVYAARLQGGLEREHVFAPPRRWRFDFAWPDRMIALEVEGGTWIGGGHNRGADYERNCEKYNEAALRGWILVRVTSTMIKDGRAIEVLERAFKVVAEGRGE